MLPSIKYNQVENYPVWMSVYDGPKVDLSVEPVREKTNRNKSVLEASTENALILKNYLLSVEFKDTVIETLKKYQLIERLYPPEFLENMSQKTHIGFQFQSQPYTVHPIHLDYRNNVAQGLLYFDEEHNPLHSTKVYPKYPLMSPVIESNTKFGNGILMLNSHNSWHGGGNLDNDTRYFVLYSLVMNI